MTGPADLPGPLVFVADLTAPRLLAEDHHHLERVLRLRSAGPIVLSDGAGRYAPGVFGVPAAESVEVVGPVDLAPRPAPALGVGFALIKGDRPEWVVQKLTELGVDRIVPFVADRSIVRWDAARAAKQVQRLRRVARGAASQSRRAWIPEIEDVTGLGSLVERPCVALAQRGGGELVDPAMTVLIGPEGGWTHAELDLPVPHVALGDAVLRAETAAVAAGVLLADLRRRCVRPC